MKKTRYFEEQVQRKREYLKEEWCERVLKKPLKLEVQADGRIRFWAPIPEFGNRVLRVVTLADKETVHNAFFDRNFEQEGA